MRQATLGIGKTEGNETVSTCFIWLKIETGMKSWQDFEIN